jgi:hypothetical protein
MFYKEKIKIFLKKILSTRIKNIIFYKNLSNSFTRNINNNTYNFYSSSPTICINPYLNKSYIMNLRYVDYFIENNGKTILNNEKIITMNKILILDTSFNTLKEFDLEYSLRNVPYNGIEDIRIFNFENNLYYIGSYYDTRCCNVRIVTNKVFYNTDNDSYSLLTPKLIKPNFQTENITEKNWVFFNNNDSLNIIYKWYPLYICSINYEKEQLDLVKVDNNIPLFFNRFRGSTCGVEYDNKIYFVVHTRFKILDKISYNHVFVVFNKDMSLVGYSRPFKFENTIIEYCIGFVKTLTDNNFILTYSCLDRTSKMIILNIDFVNSLIYKL